MLQTLPATITDVLMLVLDVTEKTTAETTVMNRIAVIRQKMRVIVKKCVKPSVMAVKYLISHGSFVSKSLLPSGPARILPISPVSNKTC